MHWLQGAPAEARRGHRRRPLPKPDHDPAPALDLDDVIVEPRIDSSPSGIGSEDDLGLPREGLPPREGYIHPHTVTVQIEGLPRQTSVESKKSASYSSELSEDDLTRTQTLAKLEAHEDYKQLSAIPAHTALRGFCRTFRGNGDNTHRKAVPAVEEFWSHSRSATPFHSTCSLLLYYNGLPSVLWGSAAALAVACLPRYIGNFSNYHRYAGLVVMLSGALASVFVMIVWRTKRMVFLDKTCIDQTNDEEKRKGIVSLGYSLRNSKRMLILWDITFYTRLWCVYEFAVHLKLKSAGESKTSLRMLPTVHGTMTLFLFLAVIGKNIMYVVAVECIGTGGGIYTPSWTQHVAAACLAFACIIVLCARSLGEMIADFTNRHAQLENFALRGANCFCCSVNHRHPD